ncbi:MAG TPA: hypothetical protein VMZ28_12015 [Kofleriaceae bacterium]|nr:hypothetical protein [Kofleriaceae bacterium]
MNTIELVETIRIERPIEVVRPHFMDFDHHIAQNVHKKVRFTIVEQEPGRVRIRQTVPVIGTDDMEITSSPDGAVTQRNIAGPNVGLVIAVQFRADGPNATELTATLNMPVSGWKALLKPLLKVMLRSIGRGALREDKQDLESGYQPSDAARRIYNAA